LFISDYLGLYVDKVKQPYKNFLSNTSFALSLPSGSANPTVFISGTATGVSALFDNGLNIQIILNSLTTSAQTNSWLSIGITLANNVNNYTGLVSGLMGNFNQDPTDDIMFRNGTVCTETKESLYFPALETWKLLAAEENLFFYENSVKAQAQKSSYAQSFTPSFLDVLIADQTINQAALNTLLSKCDQNIACVSDSLITGVLDFGLNTKSGQDVIVQQNRVRGRSSFRMMMNCHNFRQKLSFNYFD